MVGPYLDFIKVYQTNKRLKRIASNGTNSNENHDSFAPSRDKRDVKTN